MSTPSNVVAALNALQTALNSAGKLQGAPDYVLAPIVDAAISAQATVADQITATDATILNGDGLAGGQAAQAIVAYLISQIEANRDQYNLLMIQAYLQRVALNIAARL